MCYKREQCAHKLLRPQLLSPATTHLTGDWMAGGTVEGRSVEGRSVEGWPVASFSERSAIMKWYKHLDCRFRCDGSGVVDRRYINQASNVSFAVLTAGSLAEISDDERRTTTIRKYWRLFYDFDVEFRAESVIIESLRHDASSHVS